MIIVHICGGLGNQMFQYACGYALSQKNNDTLKLDTTYFYYSDYRKYELKEFRIDVPFASEEEIIELQYEYETIFATIKRKITRKKRKLSRYYYQEPHFHFDKNIHTLSGNIYLKGFWQCEKYFLTYKHNLLTHFTLKNKLSKKSEEYKKIIRSTQSISIHIRRGDYIDTVKKKGRTFNVIGIFGLCSMEYYKKAITHIESKINNPHYFIFSDDLEWTRKHFNFIKNSTFIKLDTTTSDSEEIYLMSICKHNITANSTFSWWGTWLNQNPNKIVIAPQKWTNDPTKNLKDIIPKDWMCL